MACTYGFQRPLGGDHAQVCQGPPSVPFAGSMAVKERVTGAAYCFPNGRRWRWWRGVAARCPWESRSVGRGRIVILNLNRLSFARHTRQRRSTPLSIPPHLYVIR